MQETTANTTGVMTITDKARVYNNQIGYYQEHFINDRFNYTVHLDNGRIEMPRDIAEDYELQPESIMEERIKKVAQTYTEK